MQKSPGSQWQASMWTNRFNGFHKAMYELEHAHHSEFPRFIINLLTHKQRWLVSDKKSNRNVLIKSLTSPRGKAQMV